MNRTL